MDFSLTPEQQTIRAAIEKICARFGDDYWLAKDRRAASRTTSTRAFAEDGWLGIAMPEEYGGAGLGITEAALMMQAVAEIGRRAVRRLGAAHEHLRAQPGGGVRHRRAEAAHAAAADRGRGQGLLRRHRAERRPRHAQAQDAARCATATATSSPARRSGSRPRRSRTRCCSSRARRRSSRSSARPKA